jgi:hypothetical protein
MHVAAAMGAALSLPLSLRIMMLVFAILVYMRLAVLTKVAIICWMMFGVAN